MAERQTATDLVTLGRSDVKVTRLALGTGSFGGRVQQELGQEGFTRLVHHAYDRGIRFFETSESYGASQQMLAMALKGIPRESYALMSKVTTDDGVDPAAKLDELRRTRAPITSTSCCCTGSTPAPGLRIRAHWQDAILEAEQKKTIKSHGAQVHGLPALRLMPGNKWLDVAMIRMNHKGTRMDAEVPRHRRAWQRERSCGAREAGEERRHGRDQHEADRRRRVQPRRSAEGDAFCIPECRAWIGSPWATRAPPKIDEAIDNLNLALA